MKRLLTLLLAFIFVFALAACSGDDEAQTTAPATEVLEDKTAEVALWAAHGQYLLADGTQNGWGGKDSAVYEKSALKAISMKDVKDISEDLYKALASKEVKYLYTIDLIFGTNDAGWTTKFLNKDGVVSVANGSYAFKIAKCSVETEGDSKVYSETQWISDPNTAYVEALTPDTVFYPAWQEEADENGFSWANNPVVTGGAGLYTLVIAQYKAVSAKGTPGYGVGLVLKEKKTGIDYEVAPTEHTYGVIGSFAGSDWATDVPMTKKDDNTWTAEVTLAAGNELKVRADGAWADSWGTADGGNITVEADGTYVVTLTFEGETGTVTVAPKA